MTRASAGNRADALQALPRPVSSGNPGQDRGSAETAVLEPTNLLLLACALIYGLIGEPQEAAILLVFVAGISLLDAWQQHRSRRALCATMGWSWSFPPSSCSWAISCWREWACGCPR